jgi:hypothetical protein
MNILTVFSPNVREHLTNALIVRILRDDKEKESESAENQVVRASALKGPGWNSELNCNQCEQSVKK